MYKMIEGSLCEQTLGIGSDFNSIVLAHVSALFNRARGIGTENGGTTCFVLMTPAAKWN